MSSRYVPLGPFTYTAPGDLGNQRDPMLVNPMLLRDKVGRAAVRGFYLPGKGFTCGRPNDKREYTAADALRGWTGCFKLNGHEKKKIMGRDFIALNRATVSAGLVTPHETYDYRATHDIRLKPVHVLKSGSKKFPADMVFGMPARSRKKQLLQYDTRASLLRTYQNPVDEQPLWQMPRFKNNAQPHLQTFRSSSAKEAALKHFELDHVSRKGLLGQGVYESAKN